MKKVLEHGHRNGWREGELEKEHIRKDDGPMSLLKTV